MSIIDLLSKINYYLIAAMDVPEPFSSIFSVFWVFLVVVIIFSVIIFVIFLIVFIFIFRTIIRRNKQIDQGIELTLESMETETVCQFCGQKYEKSMNECPNCGAPRK